MGLTRNDQAEAMTHLVTEDYAGFGRLIETANVARSEKIELLYRALVLASLKARASSSDDDVQKAREDLVFEITHGADVVPMRRKVSSDE